MEKVKILVVVNHEADLAFFQEQLQEYELVAANSGKAALKIIGSAKPDLVLMEAMIPGLDGYAVLSIIKKSQDTRFIPVVLLTSRDSAEEKIRALDMGADDILCQPYHVQVLRARVKNLLRAKALQDELDDVNNVVASLAITLESRHAFCADHSRRTSFLAATFAQKVINIQPFCNQLKFAGLLHDIGTISIRDEILFKPGKLDPEEFAVIKNHAVVSERICSKIVALKAVLPIIRHHHEHYDGNGYPDGLKGKAIPLGARILAIADAFAALTGNRPFRPAYSVEQALDILQTGEGTQWDPGLLNQFMQVVVNEQQALLPDAAGEPQALLCGPL